ncbi:MAG: copper chaperone PCu(A)C [Paracoccaceae bacterium]
MTLMNTLRATAVAFTTMATAALAHDGVAISDAYARASGVGAMTGAAFMVIENHAKADDRLIGARSDVAKRVELHTHKADANGVMQMLEVEEGFAIPAGGGHALARGGDHVMLMGLTRPLEQGDTFGLTLIFEKAGEVTITNPVDMERKPDHAMGAKGEGQAGSSN